MKLKRNLLMVLVMFAIALGGAGADGLGPRNQLAFYPAGGVYGLSSAAGVDDQIIGFAGLGVEYGRTLTPWLSVGLIPGITFGNLGAGPVVAEPALSLFAELRPFSALQRLFFRVSLEQLGFVLPVPAGLGFFDTFFIGTSLTTGYRFRLSPSLNLDVSGGVTASYLPDRIDLDPTVSIGLSIPF